MKEKKTKSGMSRIFELATGHKRLLAVSGVLCLMPVQPAVNAVVAQTVRSPYISAFFSFLVGTLVLWLLIVVLKDGFTFGDPSKFKEFIDSKYNDTKPWKE